jgi:hypothetical protein
VEHVAAHHLVVPVCVAAHHLVLTLRHQRLDFVDGRQKSSPFHQGQFSFTPLASRSSDPNTALSMGKGKDVVKRSRRPQTAAEKAKKRKQTVDAEQAARATFLRLIAPSAMTTETANAVVTAPAMTLADPFVADASVAFEASLSHDDQVFAAPALEPAAEQEPAPSVPMLATPAITDVSAAFESPPTHDEDYEIYEESFMPVFMRAIQGRLQQELNTRNECVQWLIPYLRENGFWIRSDCVHHLCKQLKIQYKPYQKFYYCDIHVWLPDIQFSAKPPCPNCKHAVHVRANSWTSGHPFRRVVDIDRNYFLMSRQYLCKTCKANHKESGCTYTHMGYNLGSLRALPDYASLKFPAVLSHRSGMDKKVVAMLRPYMDAGGGAHSFSTMLLELHTARHAESHLAYESELKHDHGQVFTEPWPMFSAFNNKLLYDGFVPSASFVSTLYRRQHEDIRPYYDKQVKTVECSIGSMDHSHKVPAKMSLKDGNKVFNALLTVTNSIGQIRAQTLATSTSHEQMKPSLVAMRDTQEKLGMETLRLMFTDNPVQDKDFLLTTFPSLNDEEKRLAGIAKLRNERRNATGPAVVELLEQEHHTVIADHRILVLRNTVTINDKVDALREQLAERGPTQTFALDCEWDTIINRESGRRKVGKVCLLQISYRLFDGPDGIRALLLRLPKHGDQPLPQRLVAFLTDSSNTFVGVRVKNDINLLGADHGQDDLGGKVKWIDLAMYARSRDVVQRGNHSMADLVECVLKEKLNKSDDVRCSNGPNGLLLRDRYSTLLSMSSSRSKCTRNSCVSLTCRCALTHHAANLAWKSTLSRLTVEILTDR